MPEKLSSVGPPCWWWWSSPIARLWWANWCPNALANRTPKCWPARGPPDQLAGRGRKPFVLLLSASTSGLLRLLGVKENNSSPVTEGRFTPCWPKAPRQGVIESHEHTMVRNVFRLDDRQIGSLMVPRSDVVVLDIEARLKTTWHWLKPV